LPPDFIMRTRMSSRKLLKNRDCPMAFKARNPNFVLHASQFRIFKGVSGFFRL
jgi:hypothetical protein